MATNQAWWRGAVIYQVYPRSFLDTNKDGIGDLAGITQKMDYLTQLGIDAIWVSPFFTSPMKDFGYDVADFCDVDPLFGSLDDFDYLIQAAHDRNIKVIIDQVLNHTSDQHPWFIESRQNHDNPKADWYVWADAKPDGTVPNNWLSVFGGPAWRWDSRRRQYYLHNFLDSQPDLNFHNPDVVKGILECVEFWLKRGVDGFRLDTANYYFHDTKLRNNPPKEKVEEGSIGVRLDNPYAYQLHLYDKSRPENLAFLKVLRQLLDQYPNTTTVGEVGCDFSLKTMAAYSQGGDKLHMCYSFDLLTHDNTMTHIRQTMESIETGLADGWPCWSVGNHDVERVVTRWGKDQHSLEKAKLYMILLLSLRGSVCLYQGEELGLNEAELNFEQLVDPFGINFWPEFKGRDGCRTPMPWNQNQHAGFSQADSTWLPVAESHYSLNVAQQEQDTNSCLAAYRAFLTFRKTRPELIDGDIKFLHADKQSLVFIRYSKTQSSMIAINLGDNEFHYESSWLLTPIDLPHSLPVGKVSKRSLTLPAFSFVMAELAVKSFTPHELVKKNEGGV